MSWKFLTFMKCVFYCFILWVVYVFSYSSASEKVRTATATSRKGGKADCLQLTMFFKIAPFIRANSHVKHIFRKSHEVPAHWKPMKQVCEENKNNMNNMPVPEGCWKEAYNKQNAKWNVLLLASILSCVVTTGVLWSSRAIYFHSSPPMYNCKK